ncbi:ATP-NAD kinase-like domain-containing protein [Cokeromyces recurvatus]|uniref:ATP-NAD kinase-like domain-containing protein n=1 Tax=Cokeromyces recurvatus TaxID=90255 RepID=UPI002220DDF6|nr:ATP-NAD kinase-like domain-containing protein [Cokeromyces recurvatus]KAI7905931.1 ATP-NAD kinase-like domain-containing protein [Cokeromyces recurvatus]
MNTEIMSTLNNFHDGNDKVNISLTPKIVDFGKQYHNVTKITQEENSEEDSSSSSDSTREGNHSIKNTTLSSVSLHSPDSNDISTTSSSSSTTSHHQSFKQHATDTSSHNKNSPLKRPPNLSETLHMNTSVCFEDLFREGKPSIYLFIFVNPLSGDCKGKDLIQLPFQHFRLRQFPQVQVEIHNILDEKDRRLGIESVKLVESMLKSGEIPSLDELNTKSDQTNEKEVCINETVRTRHIHVWSAGGDGTVMSVFEMLVNNHIDLNCLFFSCIPLGTGNDFGQVLGWGRTIPHLSILGKGLRNLEELIMERLKYSSAAHLDIWQVEMEAYPGGYVQLAGAPRRKTGSYIQGIDKTHQQATKSICSPCMMTRKMCNYMSIGVQGYVGSGFEKHRSGNRWLNVVVYTWESAKWVFLRKFPSVSNFIEKIIYNDETVLVCPKPGEEKKKNKVGASSNDTKSIPILAKQSIDFIIQNIPHIWGREVDLWGDAKKGLESVKNRSGPTDPHNWTPQLANDGKMEIMVIQNIPSYLKKLANIRQHVSRIGQFNTPFEIYFREPESSKTKSKWNSIVFQNKYVNKNIICIMCDGEFYVLKDPKSLKFTRYARICTLGRNDKKTKARLVQDEQTSNEY